MFKTEVELAAVVKKHLEKQGWDVYPEVGIYTGSARCDLVAIKGEKTWAIECKLNDIVGVYNAARKWRHRANLVSIAMLPVKANQCLWSYDAKESPHVGIISVYENHIVEIHSPRYYKNIHDTSLLENCSPDHKELGQAGAQSKYYTPYLKYLHQLSKLCKEHPGEELADLMDKIASSGFLYARILKSAKDGKIEDCKLWHRNHKDYLYPIGYGPHGKDKV